MAEKMYVLGETNTDTMRNIRESMQLLSEQKWIFKYISNIDVIIDGGDTYIRIFDKNGTPVIHIGMSATDTFSCVYINNNQGITRRISNSKFEYIYICSRGIYFATRKVDSESTAYGDYCGYILSLTNNKKLGMIALGVGSADTTKNMRVTNVYSESIGDAIDQISAINYTVPMSIIFNTCMPIPTCNAPGVVSYFKYVFFMYTTQFGYVSNTATPPSDFIQNGFRYLDIGWFAIRDDIPSDDE